MGIKKDEKTGLWIARYTKRVPDSNKPAIGLQRQAKTRAEAQRIYEDLVYQINKRIHANRVPAFAKVVEMYFESRRGNVQQSTIISERLTLEKYSARWNSLTVDAITKGQILDVIEVGMKDKKDSHKKYYLKIVRGLFSYAVERSYINQNPTPQPKFKKKEKMSAVLTKNQISLLLNHAREMDSDWYPIWAAALYTGMRNGELYALQWDCVDLERGTIKVCRSWNRTNGFKDTKSGDDRIIDIAPGLMPVLQELFVNRVDQFVLPRIEKWSKGEQARELRGFLMGMGLTPMRFHDLRGSWATTLLSDGVPTARVMTMGGWKDIETMQIYLKKSAVEVSGVLSNLKFHEHHQTQAEVINLIK
ncbi:MAG: tyrosine-type recombinase/integrase [Bdellovibrionales bacterium]